MLTYDACGLSKYLTLVHLPVPNGERVWSEEPERRHCELCWVTTNPFLWSVTVLGGSCCVLACCGILKRLQLHSTNFKLFDRETYSCIARDWWFLVIAASDLQNTRAEYA